MFRAFIFIAPFFVLSCTSSVEDSKNRIDISNSSLKIIAVDRFYDEFHKKYTLSFSVGESETNYCTLSFPDTTPPFYLKKESRTGDEINVECHWNGNYYVESSKHDTEFHIAAGDFNRSQETVTFKSRFKVVSPKTEGDLYIENDGLEINLQSLGFSKLYPSDSLQKK